ncbi:enoyl-CoA hydratase/isomerase family protein [Variovorax saccharolyticus]|uniref:enoyl-CoA hydratase/isomerase family protein n=1 Tax=Variovorax saccharolyticus TaxID=3053516 RepID=UPI002578F2C2|nr:enoyl-CoA hydratase/isomerase family protein [Variovorax sp. J31P216]MDM0029544.1 enoyl-CoA hydratase/isomerase family protein [Variovorax sp. J31P216]
MAQAPVLTSVHGHVGVITLNKPRKLNAWDREMRDLIVTSLRDFDASADVGAVVMTGAGERAFSAGQDFAEAHNFDAQRAEEWIREWETFYGLLRRLSKPIVMALNGTAAGSAFQVALLGDIRIGHLEVRMGQPEINTGIASITGPWIMKEMLGMSRTIELTLTGRMMEMEECQRIGLVHEVVPRAEVLSRSLAVAESLAAKAPLAMRLDRKWFADMTETGFRQTIEAAIESHRQSYGSGEPARQMEAFMAKRGHSLA